MTDRACAVKHKAFSEEKESRHEITLRMDEARRLLRETKKSMVDVALDMGYANPSHFAQLFRRETGLSPSDYRRQR
ncbi:MAG: helix-turn-helix transcriptional regulator [Verrucomicrobiota bacterium]|jgi:AraC family transcriptional regulator